MKISKEKKMIGDNLFKIYYHRFNNDFTEFYRMILNLEFNELVNLVHYSANMLNIQINLKRIDFFKIKSYLINQKIKYFINIKEWLKNEKYKR